MNESKRKRHEMAEESLISQAKAAEMCGMTRAAIHELVDRGRLRSVEMGGRALVYLKEVEAFEREVVNKRHQT